MNQAHQPLELLAIGIRCPTRGRGHRIEGHDHDARREDGDGEGAVEPPQAIARHPRAVERDQSEQHRGKRGRRVEVIAETLLLSRTGDQTRRGGESQ